MISYLLQCCIIIKIAWWWIFIALHYDCIIITLRLHFYCMTFGLHFDYTTIAMLQSKYNQNAIKTQSKIMLHLSCSLIAFQLHFDCIIIAFWLHFYYITFRLHFDYIQIKIMMPLSCKQNEMISWMNYTCIAAGGLRFNYI